MDTERREYGRSGVGVGPGLKCWVLDVGTEMADNKKQERFTLSRLMNEARVIKQRIRREEASLADVERQISELLTSKPPGSEYGVCPYCGAPAEWRERRPNGNDKCRNGHVYPSKNAIR